MGKRKGKSAPPVVKAKTPATAEDISLQAGGIAAGQRAAQIQKRGTFLTRGQSLGASGEVLGSGPTELADVTQASGFDMSEKKQSKGMFSSGGEQLLLGKGPWKQAGVIVRKATQNYTGGRSKRWQRGHLREMINSNYADYLAGYKKRKANFVDKDKGMTI
jgi:hypothetical protein